MAWQLQEAKQKLSELVERSLREGPQTITRRGKEVVVVVAAEEFDRLSRGPRDFKEFLAAAPDLDRLGIDRSEDLGREVDLS